MITYRTVATSAGRWRRRRRSVRARGRRRWCFVGRRRRRGRLALGRLLLLLGGCGLLVVLVVGHVVLVSTISGVGIGGSIVLSIRGAVVGAGARSSLVGGAGRSTRRLLVMLLVTIVVSVSVAASLSAAVVAISTTAAVTAVAVWGRVVLEVLILLTNVGEKVFTELLGSLDVVGVGTALNDG